MISLLAKQLSEILTTEHQSRKALCEKIHCKDRELRRAVTELRKVGFNVASSSSCRGDDQGYWLGDKDEMQHVANMYFSMGYEDINTGLAIERGPDLGQMEVEV